MTLAAPTKPVNSVELPQSQSSDGVASPPALKNRYLFIDGLRGIAALCVLFHHCLLGTSMEVPLRMILPQVVQIVCSYGAFGVQIFFVISGFVIAHSMRRMASAKDFTKFVLRRQIRLDPPYWCVLVLSFGALAAERFVPGLQSETIPDLRVVLFNLFYLQGVTHVRNIVAGSWTLCLEVQFYLLTASLLIFGHFIAKRTSAKVGDFTVSLLITALAVFSNIRAFHGAIGPWFFDFWFYFASGLLCYRAYRGMTSPLFFGIAAVVLMLTGIIGVNVALLVGAVTAVAVFVACRLNKLGSWLAHPIFQYFGKISYSLYLINVLSAMSILRIGYKITGDNTTFSLLWFVLAAIVSIAAAHILYIFAEKPSLALAEKLKAKLWAES